MGQLPGAMAAMDPRKARQNWVRWMLWVREAYDETYPSDAELGRKLGVGRSAIRKLLDLEGTTAPSFETLILSKEVTGASIDQMLTMAPPPVPPKPQR